MDNNINSVEETKTEENKIEESVSQTESTVKTEEPKKGKSNNMILIILLIVILLVGAGLSYYFLIVKQQNSNPNNNGTTTTTSATGNDETTTVATGEDTTTTTTTAVRNKETSKKIDINNYCKVGADCRKDLGEVEFNGKKINLVVDISKFNSPGESGTISLNYMRPREIDLNDIYPSANNYDTTKGYLLIDGFEVYKNYFILYLRLGSDGGPVESDIPVCKHESYAIFIYDQYLNELGSFEAYQSGRPLLTTKFENDYVYYRGLAYVSETDERTKVVMKKESLDNIFDPPCLHDCEEDTAVIVSDVKECN